MTPLTYKDAGVDIRAGDAIADEIGGLARSTYRPEVLAGVGGFAGLFALQGQVTVNGRTFRDPVLAACTDGVGTKLKLAFLMKRHDTVGIDLVAMSVNDLVVQGAEPLFFLDYIGIEKKHPEVCRDIVKGVVEGCRQSGCALLGGETASLPAMYAKGEYDLAGFCVGIVERDNILDGRAVREGDTVLGLRSSGLHSNGYSLARKALLEVQGLALDAHVPELGGKLGDELLKPTLIYAAAVRAILNDAQTRPAIHALANITGSGLPGNIPRTVPNGFEIHLKKGSWPIPPVFTLIQRAGNVEDAEMFDTFNMGIGMTAIVAPEAAEAVRRVLSAAGYTSDVVGTVRRAAKADAEATVIIA